MLTATPAAATHELVRQHDRERHQLGRLVAGVAEHHALIARALLLGVGFVDAHGDIRRLLVEVDAYCAGVSVESGLIVWDHVDVNHFFCDVTKSVRVEPCAEYNDEVAARLVPNGDGTFSAPDGQVRYVIAARDITEGQRIVYGGVVCTVEKIDNTQKLAPYVEIELAGAVRFTVPRHLEITYVDKAG